MHSMLLSALMLLVTAPSTSWQPPRSVQFQQNPWQVEQLRLQDQRQIQQQLQHYQQQQQLNRQQIQQFQQFQQRQFQLQQSFPSLTVPQPQQLNPALPFSDQ